MKKTIKIISTLLVVIVITSICVLPANAVNLTKHVVGANEFKKKWSKATTYSDNGAVIGVMDWQYDTFLINEDRVITKGYSNSSSNAGLLRIGTDTSYNMGGSAMSGYPSHIELKHTKNEVYYLIQLSYSINVSDVTSVTVSL